MQGPIQPGCPFCVRPRPDCPTIRPSPAGTSVGCHPHQMRIFFEGTVRVGATCCNKLNRGCEVVTDSLRREGKNEGIVRQAGHRIIKHIHEK